jgi:hypothetical protein
MCRLLTHCVAVPIWGDPASVSFEIFNLSVGDEYDFYGNAILEPVGENLYRDSVIRLVSSEDDLYGFKVTNNGDRDLYLNAFYFDNTDFSICMRRSVLLHF